MKKTPGFSVPGVLFQNRQKFVISSQIFSLSEE